MKKISLSLFVVLFSFVGCGKGKDEGSGGGGGGGGVMFAEYDLKATAKGSNVPTIAVLRIEKVDATKAKVVLTIQGQSPQTIEEFSIETLPNREQSAEFSKNCKESLLTKAGTFNTCYYEQGDEKMWWGDVPFSTVRRIGPETFNGENLIVDMSLRAYSW